MPLQIYPFIAHSQCCSKHCWANLAHSAILKSPRELRNKNSALVATFLRLGIVAISPIADCCPKTRRKWLCRGLLPRCQGGGELPIAKKMQKSRDFCFRDGRITATGRICRKTRKVSNGNEGKCLKGVGATTTAGRIPRKGTKESGASALLLRFAAVASMRTMGRIIESTERGLQSLGSRLDVLKIISNRVLCSVLIASKLSQVA